MCAHLQEAHVDVHDLVIEPVQAIQAAQQPPWHLDVAGLVVSHNLCCWPSP